MTQLRCNYSWLSTFVWTLNTAKVERELTEIEQTWHTQNNCIYALARFVPTQWPSKIVNRVKTAFL